MSDEAICPFYNVGYCKYKDKCLKHHENKECHDTSCRRKKCSKRHRRPCKYGNKCTYFKRSTFEFKHEESGILLAYDRGREWFFQILGRVAPSDFLKQTT